MRCYYCGKNTDNIPERLGNIKIPVCDKRQCQQDFWVAEQDQKERDRNYDNWRLRSE
jgi:hypothetical protein